MKVVLIKLLQANQTPKSCEKHCDTNYKQKCIVNHESLTKNHAKNVQISNYYYVNTMDI